MPNECDCVGAVAVNVTSTTTLLPHCLASPKFTHFTEKQLCEFPSSTEDNEDTTKGDIRGGKRGRDSHCLHARTL
ncbi:hypothetical protein TcWFU_002067 [Taenia crassiceps]|uniref:Uncharacterized protein n=1 Tax=Taenia crassiceps TaxID=6207 RepID=A0ABR4Q455_9CEST